MAFLCVTPSGNGIMTGAKVGQRIWLSMADAPLNEACPVDIWGKAWSFYAFQAGHRSSQSHGVTLPYPDVFEPRAYLFSK